MDNKKATITTSAISLAFIALLFTIILVFVNHLTAPIIARYAEQKKSLTTSVVRDELVIKPVFPESDKIEKLGTTTFHDSTADFYRILKGSAPIGYAIHAFGIGYQSTIHAFVATNADFTVRSITIISQAETEGLGTRISEPDFLNQCIGKSVEQMQVVIEPDSSGKINAITAATISSKALIEDAVVNSLTFLKETAGR